MLDPALIREQPDHVARALKTRGLVVDLEPIHKLDAERRELLARIEALRHQRNLASDEIARLKRQEQATEALIEAMRQVGDELKALETQGRALAGEHRERLLELPNLPDPSVPVGANPRENVEIRRWGTQPAFTVTPKPHWELGSALGILEFERAAKVAKTRFSVSWGMGARLERALIAFMLDIHTKEHGYTEVLPPFLVNREAMLGTGQLPRFHDEMFYLERDALYLIPTGEVPLTNLHRDEVLREADLPLSYVAHTPCFRREAGAYGKEARGIIRQHQFNKVELVQFTTPEQSAEALDRLVHHAETILQRLGLHYRVVALCTGDLGFAAAKTYDLEVWMPGQDTYKEVSSCSGFSTFQARRCQIRYRTAANKTRPVHTLNGSGLAVGRTVAALLEQGQEADGAIRIPEALKPYLDGLERITKASHGS